MKKPLRGLVLSWFYPPGNSSEGLVTYKLLKNSQYDYDVFTRGAQDETIWDRKVQESQLTSKNATIFTSKANQPTEWIEEAVDFFVQNHDRYDFIMSRSMTIEPHEAAIQIKKRYPDIKWVASFGDPLVDSPYIPERKPEDNPYLMSHYLSNEHPSLTSGLKLLLSPTRNASKFVWKKRSQDLNREPNRWRSINSEVFRNADLLVFNNQYQFDRAFVGNLKQYRKKGIVVNHSFDLTLYPKPTAHRQNTKLQFCYVGHLDDMRNASALLDALKELKRFDAALSDKVAFNFYGHMSDGDKAKIITHSLQGIVSVHSDIDYLESLQHIQDSDWLLLIDANLNSVLKEYIYFPAKLADYLGAKKNILAITQLDGATADVMRSVRCGQIVTHCADEIALYLAKIIYQKYNPTQYMESEWQKYNAVHVAAEYDRAVARMFKG